MRPKVKITLVGIICIALILVWLFRPKGQDETPSATMQGSESQQAALRSVSNNPANIVASHSNELKVPQAAASHQIAPGSPIPPNPGFEAWKQNIHRQIEFYGKVVDEKGQPIEGANIFFTYNQFVPPEGSFETNTVTDTNGLFSLSGVMGSTLSVRVEKAGYYTSKKLNQEHFDYMPHSNSTPFQPTPSDPVIFHLRKKGAGSALVTSRHGMYPELEISGLTDGSPARVNFFNQKVGGDGQMELSAIKPAKGQPANEWSFRMSIPDGGFVEQNDEFPFEAPQSGYAATIEFSFKAGDTNWTENFHKSYYIVFGQPPNYGRIDIATGIYRGVSLRYVINPDGSRNLEPDPNNTIQP